MKVSIIIPCYNCGSYVATAIESALKQEIDEGFEILLVDNSSTDDTLKILNHYANRFSNITILQEERKGAPFARNKGIDTAKGEWIQFLDSDDELKVNKINNQLAILSGANAATIIGSYAKVKNGVESIRKCSPNIDVWVSLIKSNLGITSANLFRRDILERIGGWNESLTSSQEYDLMFRILANQGEVGFSETIDTFIHFQENSVSQTTNLKKQLRIAANAIELRLRIKSFLKEKSLLTYEREKAIKIYIYAVLIRHGEVLPQLKGMYDGEVKGLSIYYKVKAYLGYISWYVFRYGKGKGRMLKMVYYSIVKIGRLF